MFLENSRYKQQPTAEVVTRDGRTVLALKLRKLAAPTGLPHTIHEHDRLDILAQQKYDDATKFWHVADANTELQANDLVVEPQPSPQNVMSMAGATLKLPET